MIKSAKDKKIIIKVLEKKHFSRTFFVKNIKETEMISLPRKPLKPCSYPGCPKLTERTYCEEHEKAMTKRYEQNDRDPLHGKRYGRSWQRIRGAYVAAHPLCERCMEQGRYVPAEEVHHIRPLRDGGTNDWNNLKSLCRKCHAEVHAEMGDRRTWKRTP